MLNRFCAGPQHRNTDRIEPVVQLFEKSGVRASFSGHEYRIAEISSTIPHVYPTERMHSSGLAV